MNEQPASSRIQTNALHIRSVHPNDLDEILPIEHAVYSCPWSNAMLERAVMPQGTNGGRVARLEDTGQLVGYAFYLLIPQVETQLLSIAVHPDFQRRGVASALLQEVIRKARQADTLALLLEVRESNQAARQFYAREGFQYLGRRRGYYDHPREDALILHLDLR